MKRPILFLMVSFLSTLPLFHWPASAQKMQTPPPGVQVAEAPDVKSGSWWVYQDATSGRRGKWTVREISGSNLVVGQPRGDVTYTKEWNVVNHPGDLEPARFFFEPDSGTFSFPMWPGKKWKKSYAWRQGPRAGSGSTEGKALEWEKVNVPAGEFLALHFSADWAREITGFSGRMPRSSGRVNCWYVPQVKNCVKFEAGTDKLELVSYELK